MHHRRPKILFLTEFTKNRSGFARLANETLIRLYDSGLYEIAELAAYISPVDPLIDSCPWKVFPCVPHPEDKKNIEIYQSHPNNVNGRHLFNDVCLEFEPDIVVKTRDQWYSPHVDISPFRNLFNLAWQYYTCDGEPQQEEWIQAVINCEVCFTYSKWGEEVLKTFCGPKGNILELGVGVNNQTFFPIYNKKEIHKFFGFKDDCLIVGMVCRNQPRKLLDDLLQSFTHFLLHGPKELTQKTYLYLNTGWPDLGYELPKLLIEYGIGSKVLFTYHCSSCNNIFASVYSDVKTICKHCGQATATLPRVSGNSVTEQQLNLIYNFFDVYIQLASNGGLELPAIEAIACGVPALVSEHSGMHDIIDKCKAIPVKVLQQRREPEMNRLMGIPDNNDLAQKLVNILSLPDSMRKKLGHDMYLRGKEAFNWDKVCAKLIENLNKLPLKDWRKGPIRLHKPNILPPETVNQMTNEQFVMYLYRDVIGRPELFNSYKALNEVYSLTYEFTGQKPHFRGTNRNQMMHDAIEDNKWYNSFEEKRCRKFGLIK